MYLIRYYDTHSLAPVLSVLPSLAHIQLDLGELKAGLESLGLETTITISPMSKVSNDASVQQELCCKPHDLGWAPVNQPLTLRKAAEPAEGVGS